MQLRPQACLGLVPPLNTLIAVFSFCMTMKSKGNHMNATHIVIHRKAKVTTYKKVTHCGLKSLDTTPFSKWRPSLSKCDCCGQCHPPSYQSVSASILDNTFGGMVDLTKTENENRISNQKCMNHLDLSICMWLIILINIEWRPFVLVYYPKLLVFFLF